MSSKAPTRVQQTSAFHFGSGEPILLLQPFLLSPHVWERTAHLLSDSYEVFVPALAGHWGGPPVEGWHADINALADAVEKQLDEIGWDTCHIVGNSLGGWIAFELERRGRARTVTAIAPAGGWRDFTLAQFAVGVEFLSLGPFMGLGHLLGRFVARNTVVQRMALPLAVKNVAAVTPVEAEAMLMAATHCPGYMAVLWSGLRNGGIKNLESVKAPVRLLLCDHDRIIPARIFGTVFVRELPADADRITMHGVGHCPMLEAPDRVARLITEHIRAHRTQLRAV